MRDRIVCRLATIAAMTRRVSVLAAVVWLGSATASAQGDLRPLLAKVPDAAVAVAAVADPAALAESLAAWLLPVPEALPEMFTTRLGVGSAALQLALEGTPAAWLRRMAGKGLVVALLPATSGFGAERLAIARPPDLAAAEAWLARHAAHVPRVVEGDLLLLGSSAAAIECLPSADAGGAGRWSTRESLVQAAGDEAVAAVDLSALRAWLGERMPRWDRVGGAARFAFAPMLHVLAAATFAELRLHADASRLSLLVRGDASLRTAPLGALLADAAVRTACQELPTDGLASLVLDRSLRALLSDPAAFLPADGVQAVQGFLSIADALDGPRTSFVDDLVGGLHEPIQLLVLPASADDETLRSPLVLPEFALCAGIDGPDAEATVLRTAAVLTTIVNAERMQRGEPPFLVRRRQDESGHGLVAEPPPWRGPGRAPFDRQLSPTVWFGGGRVAFASTARAAQCAIARPTAALPASTADRLLLRGPMIAAAVDGSRSALELARMLDEGEDRAEAQRFFDALMAIAAAIDELRLSVTAAAADTRLELELERRR